MLLDELGMRLEWVVDPRSGDKLRNDRGEDRVVDRRCALRGPDESLQAVAGIHDVGVHLPVPLPFQLKLAMW